MANTVAENVKEIYTAYMEAVDSDVAPDLAEPAKLFEVDVKVVKTAAKKGNWEVRRLREKARRTALLEKVRDDALEKEAINIAREMGKMMRRDLKILDEDLPKFHAELLARMPTMEDKEFLGAYKLLLEIKKSTQDIVTKVGSGLNDEVQKAKEPDGMNLGLGAEVMTIIQKRIDNPEAELTEDELMNQQIGEAEEEDLFANL